MSYIKVCCTIQVFEMKSDRVLTRKEARHFDTHSCVIQWPSLKSVQQLFAHSTCSQQNTAGRRPSVPLEKVLKFVTGSKAESVLGYGKNPHIASDCFVLSTNK